ncbi:hypothetical protein H9L01_08080 [Erysipelothrix inopinata]|uniref:Uncharacterized protein n=1 Tax=Erysipelothrix inopinata TaxID=225084 RepID=A0A7G9RXJ8_9FIRM|nr:hypothetical protein [Erysipelothrix inopinata]QNN60323.1 hypothetical protein H9L01_08080 [Erysipelothrix inopinata]
MSNNVKALIISMVFTFLLFNEYIIASISEIVSEGGYYPSPEKASWMDSVFIFLILCTLIISFFLTKFIIKKIQQDGQ